MKIDINITKDSGLRIEPWCVQIAWKGKDEKIYGYLDWFDTWDEALKYALSERRHVQFVYGEHNEPPC